jgi:hypothetical protein
MTPDLWLLLGAGLVTGAMTLLFACLQVAGVAADAADRALARSMLVGVHLPPLQSSLGSNLPDPGHVDGA